MPEEGKASYGFPKSITRAACAFAALLLVLAGCGSEGPTDVQAGGQARETTPAAQQAVLNSACSSALHGLKLGPLAGSSQIAQRSSIGAAATAQLLGVLAQGGGSLKDGANPEIISLQTQAKAIQALYGSASEAVLRDDRASLNQYRDQIRTAEQQIAGRFREVGIPECSIWVG